MVKIVVPSVWTADRRSSFDVDDGPLFDVLERFVELRPDCRDRVLDDDGRPLMFVNVAVDDHLVPRHEREETVVPDGSTVTLLSPMAGG